MKKEIKIDVKKVKAEIQSLRDSCQQAMDGSWDYNSGEGSEGFEAMSDGCETLAKMLGIKLDEYVNEDDEEDEED